MRRTTLNRTSHQTAINQAVCETMETRRMLAATAVLASGTLTITGTGSADTITLNKSGTKLNVVLNGTTKQFTYSSVNKIVAELNEGDDAFTATSAVNKPMEVQGRAGRDTITGGSNNDRLYGGSLGDVLNGGAGADSLYGGTGTDILRAGSGNDDCFGGDDSDYLMDEAGSDRFFGDNGDDYLYTDQSNTADADQFHGGAGSADYMSYFGRSQGVRIVLDDLANDGYAPGATSVEKDNVHADIERILGTDYSDTITCIGNHHNVVWAYGGDDSVLGGNGDDVLNGMNGNDVLNGEAGNDKMYGGNGNDIIFSNTDVLWETVDGGDGFDMAFCDKAFNIPLDTLTSIEWSA
jgi:Ca2+-binding RTX toxin-like protein